MTAARIIRRIRDAGGAISLADDRLKLSIPKSLSDELMPEIREAKDAIRRALEYETGDPWDREDYTAYFDERAAIRQFDGGAPVEEAETGALEDVAAQWLHHNPPQAGDAHVCAHCQHPLGRVGNDGVPVLAGYDSHLWLHRGCHGPFLAARREVAKVALAEMGISAA